MGNTQQVWVIDDDRSIRWVLEKALEKAQMEVRSFPSAEGVLEQLSFGLPDVVITDVRMSGMDGLSLLAQVHQAYPDLPVIIMTAHSDLDSAVAAFHGGAFEYLPKPFDVDEAVEQVRRACRHAQGAASAQVETTLDSPEMIGEAPAMQEVFR
ncbi:MAG: response regulator, partial [Gammaproteobacteria bacterium]|nr:response regulator [Gammaproteobacteria bacterium]